MGDTRYDPHLERLKGAADKAAQLRAMSDEEVVQALAAASKSADTYFANVLATEAMNRMQRSRALADALAASEARYRSLFHSVREPVVAADLERRITDCNAALEDLLGYRAEELRGLDTRTLYAREDEYEAMGRMARERMLTREPAVARVHFLTKDGQEVFVEAHGSPLIDQHGKVVGFVALLRDLRRR